MLDLRDALGGRWASTASGSLALFPPASLLVLLQESTRGVPTPSLLIASAVAQHLCAALVAQAIVATARRRWSVIPIELLVGMWIAVGIARGVVGGLVCIALGDGEGEFLIRITFWISICLVWIPVFGYTAAQLDFRRGLLVAHTAARELRDDALRRSRQSTGELSARLVSAIRDAVAPAISDISHSLAMAGPRLEPAMYRAIGNRIAAISRDADSIIAEGSAASPGPSAPPEETTLLGAAVSFERERPVFSGVLTGIALTAVIVPNALLAEGLPDVAEGLLCVFFTTVVLISLMVVQERIARRSQAHSVAFLVAATLLAGIAGSLLLVYINFGQLDTYDWILAGTLLPGVTASALAISTAMGLASANINTERETVRLVDEARQLEESMASRVDRVRASLADVLHGPLQGRLAACVMALTFHAEERPGPQSERSTIVSESVIAHLESVSRDLDALVASGVVEPAP
ncbi:hypothetical protein EYE40_06830 [Glaciihabitans arcticus]|uniref:Uncharacterized protein n=1 Tax=Glaciihabitans arcticus TaxID=2668039 RepID=A0A4Q9GU48_9MICO|nr:hypothetical protein [Glaciihabitans arcticus]TBN57138.1 hypothetical protein EYE40_06830 [Glaciihabitans arcticus]